MLSNTGSLLHEYKDITQHEIHALKMEYNLADAHTHQSQSKSQQKIIKRLPQLWYEAENTKQHEMEDRFIEKFFTGQKQYAALTEKNVMLVYAASIAMVITANYLMQKKMSVSLIEPCFDNIADILHHMQIKTHSFKEEYLHDPNTIYENLKKHVKGDALFLVDPNNPTGFSVFCDGKQKAYKEILRYCKDFNKLLIIDYCFATFFISDQDIEVFDVYKLLEESGVDYITMEDTGKTWPVQDAKVAMIKTNKRLYPEIYNIQTSYLLNVSPFILNFLTQYLKDSERDSLYSAYRLLQTNISLLKKELAGSILEVEESKMRVSVAWCKIKDSNISATELQAHILKSGVYVLPGTYFFWNNKNEGEHHIRIALARNTDMFTKAIKQLRTALDNYAAKK